MSAIDGLAATHPRALVVGDEHCIFIPDGTEILIQPLLI
jgi:hypothetical protein